MINLKAHRKTSTINVGVNPVTNINVNNPVQYPPPDNNFQAFDERQANGNVCPSVAPQLATRDATVSEFSNDDPEKEALLREINVLKLIIDIQHSNPMIVNKYIVADDEALGKIVGLLCNASEVHLDADDVGVGCISKKTYRKVNSIYVVVNGETLNLKYDFPSVMKTLKDLHISTKFVW